MTSVSSSIDRILFNSFALSAEALGIYRISFALFLLLVIGVPITLWISYYPDVFYHPPAISPGALLSGFPDYWVLLLISISNCLLTISLLFGYKTRLVSILLGLSVLAGQTFAFSFGKIDHIFLIWLIPLLMAFSNWGAAYSIDARQNSTDQPVQSWPVSLLMIIFCLAMFSAGVFKLLGGWLDFATQAVNGHLFKEYYVYNRQKLLAPLFLNLKSPFVWELFDYGAVLMELTFLIAFIRPNLFRFFVLLVLVFHLLNYLILNIVFNINFIFYFLFINWQLVFTFLKKYQVLSFLYQAINYRNFGITAIVFLILLFSYWQFNSQIGGGMAISPLIFIFQILFRLDIDDYKLILGGWVIGTGIFLACLNVIYYFRSYNKKPVPDTTPVFSNKALG